MQDLMGDYFQYVYTTRDDYAYLDVDGVLEGITHRKAQEGIAGLKAITKVAASVGTSFPDGGWYNIFLQYF